MPANVFIGKDIDGDDIPDVPLRFEMDDSKTVIEFPLGFCPGAASENFVYGRSNNKLQNATNSCQGQWGLVLKEWEDYNDKSLTTDNWQLTFVFLDITLPIINGTLNLSS